ncbi:DNA-binding protein [Planctomicrobium sp. SH661]|uniref:DNA-binding protein n=1 Tax=Planctomicrobium sp. SH661 TaxID=3448124 RepID=UPI003F5B4DB3
MKILELQLDESESIRFCEAAERLGVTEEELLRASVEEKLLRLDQVFRSAAEYVLEKNEELYRRLA